MCFNAVIIVVFVRFLAKLVQNMSAVLLINTRCVYAREERGSSQKDRNQVENRQLDAHLIMFTFAHVNCSAFDGAVWHFHKKNQCRAYTTFCVENGCSTN